MIIDGFACVEEGRFASLSYFFYVFLKNIVVNLPHLKKGIINRHIE